jgi:hypothetical protein
VRVLEVAVVTTIVNSVRAEIAGPQKSATQIDATEALVFLQWQLLFSAAL